VVEVGEYRWDYAARRELGSPVVAWGGLVRVK